MFVDTVSGDPSALLTTPRNRIFLHRTEASHLLRLSVFFRKPRKRRFSVFYSVRFRVVCVFRGYPLKTKEFHHRKPSSSGFRSVVKVEYIQETKTSGYACKPFVLACRPSLRLGLHKNETGRKSIILSTQKHRVSPIPV